MLGSIDHSAADSMTSEVSGSATPDLGLERLLHGWFRDVSRVVRHHRDGETGNHLESLGWLEPAGCERFEIPRVEVTALLDQRARQARKRCVCRIAGQASFADGANVLGVGAFLQRDGRMK